MIRDSKGRFCSPRFPVKLERYKPDPLERLSDWMDANGNAMFAILLIGALHIAALYALAAVPA